MRQTLMKGVRWLLIVYAFTAVFGQDLAPRAYLIAPLNSNAITVTWGRYRGGIDLNGAIPIEDASGAYDVPVLSYSHSFGLLGRSANFTGSLPYAFGSFDVTGPGGEQRAHRSGLLDASARFSVNLKGGPAMRTREWTRWKQTVLLGASLKILAPTGQYDPNRAINWGANRWAFKPELGYSQRWGGWLVDSYGGVWFFTTNDASYASPRPVRQTEVPIGSFEGHLSHDFNRASAWLSLDANYWFGGVTTRSGIRNAATQQASSRLGGTASFPVTRSQSIKVAYS
jgi:hypothetical protein